MLHLFWIEWLLFLWVLLPFFFVPALLALIPFARPSARCIAGTLFIAVVCWILWTTVLWTLVKWLSVQHTKSQRIQWLTRVFRAAVVGAIRFGWCRWCAHAICIFKLASNLPCSERTTFFPSLTSFYEPRSLTHFPRLTLTLARQLQFRFISSFRRLFRIHSSHLLFGLKFSCRFSSAPETRALWNVFMVLFQLLYAFDVINVYSLKLH